MARSRGLVKMCGGCRRRFLDSDGKRGFHRLVKFAPPAVWGALMMVGCAGGELRGARSVEWAFGRLERRVLGRRF